MTNGSIANEPMHRAAFRLGYAVTAHVMRGDIDLAMAAIDEASEDDARRALLALAIAHSWQLVSVDGDRQRALAHVARHIYQNTE